MGGREKEEQSEGEVKEKEREERVRGIERKESRGK